MTGIVISNFHQEIKGKTVKIVGFSAGAAVVLYEGKLYSVYFRELEDVQGDL